MKRLRKHPLLLVTIAVALPLGVAILYFDFYDDSDLICFRQISTADSEDLLNFLRKHPKVLVAVDAIFQPAGTNVSEANSFHSFPPASTAQRCSVLRC